MSDWLKRYKQTESNPSVVNKMQREELSCPHCRPHKNENAKRKCTHGAKKPKRKNKRD